MTDIAIRRKLLEHTNTMIRTTNPDTCMREFAHVIDCLGSLLSEWTGEKVRVQITAEGQEESVDMEKQK
jgi:hypothetical protein